MSAATQQNCSKPQEVHPVMNIWFQSDPHFFHKNILTFTDEGSGELIRPGFSTVEDMNNRILEEHNARVKPSDKVYWLGDIVFKVNQEFIDFFKQFNGSHRLIFGNHDPVKELVGTGLFRKLNGTWRCFGEKGIVPFCCSHIPLHDSAIVGEYNVHGHIHQNPSPTNRHINICPEITNYCPTHWDELQFIMKSRLISEMEILVD